MRPVLIHQRHSRLLDMWDVLLFALLLLQAQLITLKLHGHEESGSQRSTGLRNHTSMHWWWRDGDLAAC